MVTHNMKDAIAIGNRLIMMNNGKVIYDVAGEEKKNLTVDDLSRKFSEASGEELCKRQNDAGKINIEKQTASPGLRPLDAVFYYLLFFIFNYYSVAVSAVSTPGEIQLM